MNDSILQKTSASRIKSPNRVVASLISQFSVSVISLSVFFFFAFTMFYKDFPTRDGSTLRVTASGYEAFSLSKYFGSYANVFLILTLALAFILLLGSLAQIFSAFSVHTLNIILLGLQVISFEFLMGLFSFGSWILYGLLCLDFLQYFIFLDKHHMIDYCIFGLTLLLILAMIPSALVSSIIFQ